MAQDNSYGNPIQIQPEPGAAWQTGCRSGVWYNRRDHRDRQVCGIAEKGEIWQMRNT